MSKRFCFEFAHQDIIYNEEQLLDVFLEEHISILDLLKIKL